MIPKIAAFDLDGTLLNDEKKVSEADVKTLHTMAQRQIFRVAATGRNLYSLKKVLPENFPLDYAIFSSGSGIYDWKQKKLLKSWHITKADARLIIKTLDALNINFLISEAIPNNHKMLSRLNYKKAIDLINYTSHYKEYVSTLKERNLPETATQAIALINDDISLYSNIKKTLDNLKCILVTSPINHKSLWVEIFNKDVSKGNALLWLCNVLNISIQNSFGIGNDFNDLDLLETTKHSFVVENAPNALKSAFKSVDSNNNNGFSQAFNQLINA